MSEPWMGLHNPEQHEYPSDSGAYCRVCAGVVCWRDRPCRCCLAAEVEALRGENKALKYMVERDTAAIQRVRGELDWINDHPLGVDADEDNAVYSTVSRILRALDGDA